MCSLHNLQLWAQNMFVFSWYVRCVQLLSPVGYNFPIDTQISKQVIFQISALHTMWMWGDVWGVCVCETIKIVHGTVVWNGRCKREKSHASHSVKKIESDFDENNMHCHWSCQMVQILSWLSLNKLSILKRKQLGMILWQNHPSKFLCQIDLFFKQGFQDLHVSWSSIQIKHWVPPSTTLPKQVLNTPVYYFSTPG